ncbi:MAG TPA: triple tyrosine motif-containing protein, partial [Terriglobia bacterium]|nr:triple tyrosine motif-containing protein [Terriglobia bacterium]
WAGTEDGLNAFDPESDDFRVYKAPGVSPNRERAIAEDATGVLWLGTWYWGVHRFDPVTGQFTIYRHSEPPGSLSNDAVAAIAVDHSGIVWAGTEHGLNRFDPATQVFTAYYDRDGLPNNNVNGILEDAHGDLWITTNNGLSNFNRQMNVFKNYFRSDGVLGDFTAAWKSRTGEMFFASYTGLMALSADAEVEIPYVPPVLLTDFQLLDKPAPIGIDSPLKQSISVTKHLTLSHAQNNLSFEFAALSYANPQQTRYRYRLDGLESDWTEVDSSQRFARYTSLAPGNYVFRVQSRTSRAPWSEREAAVGILILPPWWSTGWFRTACALAVVMMLWFAYRFRVRQLAAQLNLRFEERLAERTRIARDLHDTLLQGFLSASMQLNVAVDAVPSDSPARPLLSRALQVMGKVIDEGRNILRGLRSSDTVSIDLEQVFSRIPEELAVREPIDFRVIVEGRPRSLHPTLRDEAYRIGREALVNAFCHSRATSIEVELRYSARQLRIVVRDNGCGIDVESLRSGREGHWGLRGMRERAESIGGRINVWSRPGAGTEVEISIPGRIAFQNFRRKDSRRWFVRLADQHPSEDAGKENLI